MGTRARVGMVNEDGTVTSIYTHWDGYPSHHGPILLGHYPTPEKIKQLLTLGDLSVLAEQIGEKHDFSSRDHDDWCTAYDRDRGETDVAAMTHANKRAFEKMFLGSDQEWAYLFEAGRWTYRSRYAPWEVLTDQASE